MRPIFYLFLLSAPAAAQWAQEKPTLSLSPSVVTAKGTYGQSLTQTLTLSNRTAGDFAFEMIANDVLMRDGKREFIPAGETPHSIAESGVVKANSSLWVDVRITIPPETGVRAVVAIFHGVAPSNPSQSSVGFTASLGTLITFQLGGELKMEAEPVRVQAGEANSNLTASVWLKNTGTEPYIPEGVAAFVNANGALVGKSRFPAQRLLPGERLEFSTEYPAGLTPGNYRVLCSFQYEDRDLTVETSFSVP
jgi:hypothetical protein